MGGKGPNQRLTTTGHLLLMLPKGAAQEMQGVAENNGTPPLTPSPRSKRDSFTLPGTGELALASRPLNRPHMSSNSPLGGPRIPSGDSGSLESRTHPTGGQAGNWRVGGAPHTGVQAWVVGSWIKWGLHPEPADPSSTWATVLAQAWGPPGLTKEDKRPGRSPCQGRRRPALGQL